ncbi:hypothetical protein [Rubripirellula reticaptiva]|uniref:Uncharacterized protein n=1 Tax=Rubripirellula reticaptiva TaxID=2528013 RepID=A0A5C6EU87_9BACT|nr:hypothetical protein [Rubripirellula reticaptiva]TWU51954.1 hypothetical protein Poly59_35510 [Rubripirellula reticaptiva]
MERRFVLAAAIAVVCGFVGCSSARYVFKDPDVGVVAMPSNSERNREKAVELMNEHFPGGYVIDREEETVIGLVTHEHIQNNASAHDGNRGDAQIHTAHATATTTDKTEYRITYRRK